MRGKVVNFCMALLNLVMGVGILIYSLNIPKQIIELTVQERYIVNIIKIVMYVGLGLTSFCNIIHYFLNGKDTTRKIGYFLALFSISFIFIKEWPICIFSFIAALLIMISTVKERWVETNSITAISLIGIIAVIILVPTIFSFGYKGLGAYIVKKENEKESPYDPNFFKYIIELDIQDVYLNVRKDGKYGYITLDGNTVIDFKYDFASPFVNIHIFDKDFQIALVCANGRTEIIMKNLRSVMSYRSESMDEDYETKIHELEDIYYHTLGQTQKMQYEIDTNYIGYYRLTAYENQENTGVIRFNYTDEYDIIVSQSSLGFGDTYYLTGKNDSGFNLELECEHLAYTDQYLYIFSNGTIPFYDTSIRKQGWFTQTGTKITLLGNAQILEVIGDKVLIKNHKDDTIYFINSQNEQISDTYKEMYICGYNRFVVKNQDNKYMVIDSDFQKVFESEWDFVDTSLAQMGIFTFGNLKDWNAQFNDYEYCDNMNLTIINYRGDVIAEGMEQVYLKYYKLPENDKKSKAELESEFRDNLKTMKCTYIGDEFYK